MMDENVGRHRSSFNGQKLKLFLKDCVFITGKKWLKTLEKIICADLFFHQNSISRVTDLCRLMTRFEVI